LATEALGAVESLAGVGGKKTQRGITGGPNTLPVVGRLFLSPLHTRVFDDFYTRLEKLEQKHASLKVAGKSDSSITMLGFMKARSDELSELRNESRAVLANKDMPDDQKRDRFMNIHLQMVQMAKEANEMATLHRPSTPADAKKKWAEIHERESQDVIYNSARGAPNKANYKNRDEDLLKAQEAYRESREFEKARILAITDSHDKAQKLLLEHFRRDGGWELEGTKLKAAYIQRGKVLAEMFGEDFTEWRSAFRERRSENGHP
jgi:hypothetical protein